MSARPDPGFTARERLGARRGNPLFDDARAAGARPGDDRHEHDEQDASTSGPERERGTGGRHDECYACPVGSLFAEARGIDSEAIDHLFIAARELITVARSMLDAADSAVEQQQSARSRAARPRVQRIDLD